MRLQSTFTQIILISLFVISSTQLAAQPGDTPDITPGPNDNIGTGGNDPSDPFILLPDGTTILRDGRAIAPGEPLPVKTRKTGMKKTKPPVLKESDPEGLPTLSVRKDLGERSTQSKLTELKLLHQRMLNPDKSGYDAKPEVVKERYNKLYRELDEEQRVARSKGIREPAGPAKNDILRQSRLINNVLNGMPTPPREKPKSTKSNGMDSSLTNLVLDLFEIKDSESSIMASTDRVINSDNRGVGFAMLGELRQMENASKEKLDEAEKELRRLVKDGKFPTASIAKARNTLLETKKDHQAFLEYIRVYEKALHLKWPKDPEPEKKPRAKTKANEPKPPEIGPLPGVIGEPKAPGPIDFPGA